MTWQRKSPRSNPGETEDIEVNCFHIHVRKILNALGLLQIDMFSRP